MNKVMQYIYFDGKPHHRIVQIQGDFTNWRKVVMTPVEDEVDAPANATHYFKKLLN
jgi:hypothetical protein